jgi:hypothetical protein
MHLFALLEGGILRRFLWSAPTFVRNGMYSKICTILLGVKMGSKDGRREVASYAHIIPFGFCLTLKRDFISAVDNWSSKSLQSYASIKWMFVRLFSACAPQGHQVKKWLCESSKNYLQKELEIRPYSSNSQNTSVAPRVLASIAAT